MATSPSSQRIPTVMSSTSPPTIPGSPTVIPSLLGLTGWKFPASGGMAPDFTSVSVLISDPFGDSAGDGPTGVWTGGDVASTGMVLHTGVAGPAFFVLVA